MDAIRSRVQYGGPSGGGTEAGRLPPELEGNERLKNIEPRMVELITNEVHILWNIGTFSGHACPADLHTLPVPMSGGVCLTTQPIQFPSVHANSY